MAVIVSPKKESEVSKQQANIFLEYANPHAWWLTANDLHDQVKQIFSRIGESKIIKTDASGKFVNQIDGIDRTCYLIGGFALENLLKSILVYDNPQFVANAKLSRELKSHNLIYLVTKSNRIHLKIYEKELLEIFSKATVTWARYPCPLHLSEIDEVQEFSSEIYNCYLNIFSIANNEIKSLLERGWVGPYGFYGKYLFHGEMS